MVRSCLQMKKHGSRQHRLVVAAIGQDTPVGRLETQSISRAARRLGWMLEIVDTDCVGFNFATYRPLLARADGVIARYVHAFLDGTLGSLGVPVVGLDAQETVPCRGGWRTILPNGAWANVACDTRAVAETASAELLAIGLRAYAFVPMPKRMTWTKPREKAFAECVRAAGLRARIYRPATWWDWAAEREALAKWLAALPRPFGVFAANDRLAKFTLDACHTAGLQVPRDASIVGADDDKSICLAAEPKLSSVAIDFEGAGRMAVETLGSLFGKPRPKKPVVRLYGPLGVVRRGSSVAAPTKAGKEDPRIVAALAYMRSHVDDTLLGVDDIAKAMGVERRQAYRIFAATGKSIRRHVEEIRLGRIREMLTGTDLPIGDVAAACGFSSAIYFSAFVRRRLGLSPTDWRKANAR